MPHKRNPMLCESILALARMAMKISPLGMEAMIQEHERDWSSDHIEWAYLPEVCIFTDGALYLTGQVIAGLQVSRHRMEENLNRQAGLILSEAVMLAVGRHIGRQTAHEIVYACAMRAIEQQIPFHQTLGEHPVIAQFLSNDQVSQLLDPTKYTGLAGEFVDRVLEAVNQSKPPAA